MTRLITANRNSARITVHYDSAMQKGIFDAQLDNPLKWPLNEVLRWVT